MLPDENPLCFSVKINTTHASWRFRPSRFRAKTISEVYQSVVLKKLEFDHPKTNFFSFLSCFDSAGFQHQIPKSRKSLIEETAANNGLLRP